MSKHIMALAAVLLAGGIGAAAAQGPTSQEQIKGQTQESAQTQAGNPRTAGSMLPPYSQEIQAAPVAPLGPNVHKPKVNPSAAGTLTQWRENGTSSHGKPDKDTHEHS